MTDLEDIVEIALQSLGRMVERSNRIEISVENVKSEWLPKPVDEAELPPFTGTVYCAGHKTTGLGTKKWVRCKLDTGVCTDTDDEPSDPFPFNEEWYEVGHSHGDIHVPRA